MKKRLICTLLAAIMCITLLPVGAFAAKTYTINGKNVRFDDFYSSPHECWAYASKVYRKIWGESFTNQFGDTNNMLRKKHDSELKLTVEHLKEYVSAAPVGSCLRICNGQYLHAGDDWGHSQIIVQKDNKGFTVFEGGLSAYPYCREKYYTWKEYIKTDWLGGTYRYIKYIKFPGVNPETPEVTAGNKASNGKVRLTWDRVPGAMQYEIYRAESKDGKFEKTYSVTGTSYTNTSAKAGKKYYYKVRAINAVGKAGKFSEVVYRVCDLPQPVLKRSNVADTGKVKISWDAIDGAAKYEVYRATSENGSYKKLGTAKGTSYVNNSAEAGRLNYYKVKAIHEKKSSADSALSEPVSRCCDFARPTVKVKLYDGVPKLSWARLDGAPQYEIYRASGSSGEYKLLTTTKKISFVDSTAKSGRTYSYKLRAVNGTAAAASAYSAVVSIKTK